MQKDSTVNYEVDKTIRYTQQPMGGVKRLSVAIVINYKSETDKSGKVTSHEGAWWAGVDGARFGLMMPGSPVLHARYYQEIAPHLAMDRAEIVSLTDTMNTPAGEFKNVLRVVETSPLERGAGEAKYYAANVGLLQDESLKLVRYGKP